MRGVAGWAFVAVLFVGPLAATGELPVIAFETPVSHLEWDEALGAPQGPGAPATGPMALATAGLLVPAALWALAAALSSAAPARSQSQQGKR